MMITFSGIFAIYAFQTYLTISYGGVTGQRFIEKKYKWLKKGVSFDYRRKIDVYTELKNTKYQNLNPRYHQLHIYIKI